MSRDSVRSVSEQLTITDTVSSVARTPNNMQSRRSQLEHALAAVEAAVAANSSSAAHEATKQALETIHELADCAKRGEWSMSGWSADEIDQWHAHIGARNAAHHHPSTAIVALYSDNPAEERLRWDIDTTAISSLHSERQAAAYRSRLAGRGVLPALRTLVGSIAAIAKSEGSE